MLGHLCLINDNFNSEMNNNQNKIKTIFIILLLKVYSFFMNVCQTSKSQPSKKMSAQTQQ